MIHLTQAAAAGAHMLDAAYPGWFDRIDTERLNIELYEHCMIGQLYQGKYDAGVADLCLSEQDQVRLGFFVDRRSPTTRARHYAKLTDAWKEEIEERRRYWAAIDEPMPLAA